MYKYFNANPKGHKTGDCSTRAITKAAGLDYRQVLHLQCEVACKICYDITSTQVCSKVIENLGFIPHSVSVARGETRPTIATLAEEYPECAILARVANHWNCAVGGDYFDIWDSGKKSVYKFWTKRLNK